MLTQASLILSSLVAAITWPQYYEGVAERCRAVGQTPPTVVISVPVFDETTVVTNITVGTNVITVSNVQVTYTNVMSTNFAPVTYGGVEIKPRTTPEAIYQMDGALYTAMFHYLREPSDWADWLSFTDIDDEWPVWYFVDIIPAAGIGHTVGTPETVHGLDFYDGADAWSDFTRWTNVGQFVLCEWHYVWPRDESNGAWVVASWRDVDYVNRSTWNNVHFDGDERPLIEFVSGDGNTNRTRSGTISVVGKAFVPGYPGWRNTNHVETVGDACVAAWQSVFYPDATVDIPYANTADVVRIVWRDPITLWGYNPYAKIPLALSEREEVLSRLVYTLPDTVAYSNVYTWTYTYPDADPNTGGFTNVLASAHALAWENDDDVTYDKSVDVTVTVGYDTNSPVQSVSLYGISGTTQYGNWPMPYSDVFSIGGNPGAAAKMAAGSTHVGGATFSFSSGNVTLQNDPYEHHERAGGGSATWKVLVQWDFSVP